jgi:hypothetical protein
MSSQINITQQVGERTARLHKLIRGHMAEQHVPGLPLPTCATIALNEFSLHQIANQTDDLEEL